jgi:hypothetical protein
MADGKLRLTHCDIDRGLIVMPGKRPESVPRRRAGCTAQVGSARKGWAARMVKNSETISA